MTPGQPYRLVYSGTVLDRVRLLMRRAEEKGVRPRLRRALTEIEGRLELDPIGWGDPSHRLRHAKLTVYHRILDELLVVYGVHDSLNLVIPARFIPMFNHPLRLPDDE